MWSSKIALSRNQTIARTLATVRAAARVNGARNELGINPASARRRLTAPSSGEIAVASAGCDEVRSDLLAEPADQHFERVRVRLRLGAVDVLGEFALRNGTPLVVQQVAQGAIFERGQRQRLSRKGH